MSPGGTTPSVRKDPAPGGSGSREGEDELRRLRLAEVCQAVVHLAPEFPAVEAVYVFGPLVERGRFIAAAEFDVAIDCPDPETEAHFWATLEEAVNHPVNLRLCQGAVAEAVAAHGQRIYLRSDRPSEPAPGDLLTTGQR